MTYDIVLTGTVGAFPITAASVAEQLAAKDGKEELHVFLSSFGGDLQTALQIRALFAARGGVTCHLDGYVASAATVIATGAAETLIAPTAQYLAHRTRCAIDIFGSGFTAADIKARAEELLKASGELTQADALLASIYAEKTGKEADEMLALMDEEKWLAASEAVSYGFADWEESRPTAGETGEKEPGNLAGAAKPFADVAKLCAAYGLPAPAGAEAQKEERKGGQWLRDLIAGLAGRAEADRLRQEAETAKAEAETLRAKAEEAEAAKAAAEEKTRELSAAVEAMEAERQAKEAERNATEAALRAEIERLRKADGAEDCTAGLETTEAEADEASVRTRYAALAHLL